MPKSKFRKSLFKPVHLQTLLFTVAYLVFSKYIFIKSVTNENILISFFGPFTFGIVTTLVFLYFFNHEDFFHFLKGLKNKENKYLKKYYHHGKILACILIGIIGGDFFLALTIRLLINKFAYKYLVMTIAVFISTLVSVGLAKGFFSLW